MTKNNNVPQIRFKGFTDTWERRKLGEVLSLLKDGTHGTHKNSNDGVFLLSAKNIKNGEIIIDETSDRKISIEEFDSIHSTFRLQKNDVLLTIVGSIGEVAILNNPDIMTFQRSVAFLRPKENLISNFLKSEIESDNFQKELSDRKSQSAQPGIYLGELEKVPFSIPSIEEQNAIGSYFRNLDHLITLHQRKCETLKKLKKSMLQKMFPKNGKSVPEIRFAGFTDAWEQRELNSIADVRDGTHTSPQYFSSGHPFITSKNVKDGYINYDDVQFISDEDFEEINKRSKVDVNDILMGMIGTIGNLALVRETPDFAIKNVALIKDTGDIYYRYLYHCLQSEIVLNQLTENMDGGTQKFVALNRIRELYIPFPSRPEQEAIGTYFRNLDHLITLHQRKLETLKKLKKSMLQKMFI